MMLVLGHGGVAFISLPLQAKGINCVVFLKRAKDRNRISTRDCSSSSGLLLQDHRDPCPDGRPSICAGTNSSNSPLYPFYGKA